MKITINHNGYHGWHRVGITGEPEELSKAGSYRVIVSARTARRVNNTVCGHADCQCGEAIASIPDDLRDTDCTDQAVYYPSEDDGKTGEISGNYPQGS